MNEKSPPPLLKVIKRRDNTLYLMRKKGIRCHTRQKTIFYPYGENPDTIRQIRQLRDEYNFLIQFEMI